MLIANKGGDSAKDIKTIKQLIGGRIPNPSNLIWDAVGQNCCVPAHQEDRKFGEGPPDLLLLLPIRVPRLCCG